MRVLVDSAADVDSFDTCYPAVSWRWARSDTVFGRWRHLAAGEHLVRFEIIGRNPSSSSWELILDQMVLTRDPALPVRMPLRVTNLTAYHVAEGVRLRWTPVRHDTAGAPLTPDAYAVYRALGPDSLFRFLAEVPGADSVYVDDEALSLNSPVYYVVTARAGAPLPTELREAAVGRAFGPPDMVSPER